MADVKEILEGWQEEDVGFVRFELPDMHGISRSKTIPIAHAFDYAERGPQHVRRHERPGHALRRDRGHAVPRGARLRGSALFPDPDSAAVLPWMDRTARLICDAQWYDGSPLAATPRAVFRRALERARSMGFEPVMGSEFEFYLLTGDTHEPLFDGYHIFNTIRNDYVPTIRRIVEEMPRSASTSSRRTASTPGRSGRSTSRREGARRVPTTASRSRTA